MRVRFLGTRGSIASPGLHTLRYGGNTSCVEIRSEAGTLIIVDMGTGAFKLGQELVRQGKPAKGHILISHTHWDHIQGLPFFAPLFVPGNEWDIYAPRGFSRSLRDTLAGQMEYTYFPVNLQQLGATIRYHDLVEGELTVGDVLVRARYLNHPALTLGYRLEADGASVVYACDHEPHSRDAANGTESLFGQDAEHAAFVKYADLLIHDAQYVASEFDKKVSWGHSTVEYAVSVARLAGVKRLALTHHDPLRDDTTFERVLEDLVKRQRETGSPLQIIGASEGLVIELSSPDSPKPHRTPSQEAAAVPAIAGQTILLVTTEETGARLQRLLEADGIRVLVTRPSQAFSTIDVERPSVVAIERVAEAELAALTRSVRGIGNYGRELPIILITPESDQSRNRVLGITDRLVEPFSDSYARTRFRAWLMRVGCRWMLPPVPPDEDQRIEHLKRLVLLDTPHEERFDRITRLAAEVLDAPIALISLVDRERQWFKSHCGIEVREAPRDESFCAHAVFDRELLIVPDALQDDRFADNPAVTGGIRVRSYAGYPLLLKNGYCIGTVCVADVKPREFSASALDRLKDLAAIAITEIERGKEAAASAPP